MKNEVENFLRRQGCQILGKNQKGIVVVRVEGQDRLGDLFAEYTVKKNGKNYVVVVRRGEGGLDPTEPAVRQRLIELDRVFGLNGILIADPEKSELREILFKFPHERGLDFYFQFFAALFIVVFVIGIIWLMVSVRLF